MKMVKIKRENFENISNKLDHFNETHPKNLYI
jgi:hypothetical protein